MLVSLFKNMEVGTMTKELAKSAPAAMANKKLLPKQLHSETLAL